MNITMPIELYTDGSCSKNPGPGGFGYIIRYWVMPEGSTLPAVNQIDFNKGFRLTTNNRMEIMGAIYGLKSIMENINSKQFENVTQINLFSDSEYFCNAINQGWVDKWANNNWMTSGFKGSAPKPVKNQDLWEDIISIKNDLRFLNVILNVNHIKGHNGHEFNEAADKLATSATADFKNYDIDSYYENSRQ